MKYDTYSEYDPRHAALAESAFLTLWSALGAWHSDLVLVGGLVPKYLCRDLTQQSGLPVPATLDVDLGIALAADSGQYGNLRWALEVQGFKASVKHPNRLEKTIGAYPVYVTDRKSLFAYAWGEGPNQHCGLSESSQPPDLPRHDKPPNGGRDSGRSGSVPPVPHSGTGIP